MRTVIDRSSAVAGSRHKESAMPSSDGIGRLVASACLAAALVVRSLGAQELALPNRADSVKFAAFGDHGTGDRPQYDLADQMRIWHERFPFPLAITLGDNLLGSQKPADFVRKFEVPYKPLLDAGVQFFACLGNHDQTTTINYPGFQMNGRRYYTWASQHVRFFVLDSNQLDAPQIAWLEAALRAATEPWRVAYFHHPLYSDGRRHGGAVDLRVRLEPLFIKYAVNVVYSGHDHVYERLKPQHGIVYFVSGAGGSLRKGNTHRSEMTAAAYDQEQSFMLNEIVGDDLYFQVISRTGLTVDRGTIHRQPRP
jgi:3',5'-cyclic AMP phosphodiesterase CpdA